MIALGAVNCYFQRQIEPLQRFEIFTRVLCWDRKWLYVVSHVVMKGKIKPESYILQPWRNRNVKKEKRKKAADGKEEEDLTKYIFATSLSRYVFKKGRLTINPEIILERSRLLPPRPEGVGYPPRTEAEGSAGTPWTPPARSGDESRNGVRNRTVGKEAEEEEEEAWTWEDMEKERLRGLELASHFESLSGVHRELRGGDVLGRFGDYW